MVPNDTLPLQALSSSVLQSLQLLLEHVPCAHWFSLTCGSLVDSKRHEFENKNGQKKLKYFKSSANNSILPCGYSSLWLLQPILHDGCHRLTSYCNEAVVRVVTWRLAGPFLKPLVTFVCCGSLSCITIGKISSAFIRNICIIEAEKVPGCYFSGYALNEWIAPAP